MGTSCYAELIREDVVEHTLDYYSIKGQIDKESRIKEAQIAEKKEQKKKAKQEKSQVRKEKVNKFLDRFTFSISSIETYDDNILETYTQEKKDFITTVSTSISYKPRAIVEGDGQLSRTKLRLEAQGDGIAYKKYTQGNTVTFDIEAGIDQRLTKTYGVDLSYKNEKLQATESDLLEDASSEGFVDHWKDTYGGKFYADWKQFPWIIGYKDMRHRYDSDHKTSEYDGYIASFTMYLKWLAKTDFLFHYDYGKVDYSKRVANDDYTYSNFYLGATGLIAPKVTGILKVGLGEYDYDSRTDDSYLSDIKLIYKPFSRLLLNLGISAGTEPTSGSNASSKDVVTFSLGSHYSPLFAKKLTLGTDISYEDSEISSSQEDKTYKLKLTADYKLRKWLTLMFAYEYVDTTSTVVTNEFTNNVVSLGFKADF